MIIISLGFVLNSFCFDLCDVIWLACINNPSQLHTLLPLLFKLEKNILSDLSGIIQKAWIR